MKGNLKSTKGGVYAIGNFDGFHLGHQKLLTRAKQLAEEISIKNKQNLSYGIITFDPHPAVFFKNKQNYLITPKKHKDTLINSYQEFRDAQIINIAFNEDLANKEYKQFFYDNITRDIKPSAIITGEDFSFGKHKKGNTMLLQELAKEQKIYYEIVPLLYVDNEKCSSSAIREALLEGNIKKANKLLGYRFFIKAIVVKGNQLGRTLGFPTANMIVNNYVKMKHGVYVVRTVIGDMQYDSVANFGIRPSIDNKKVELLEVNIFNFEGNLYDKEIRVEFFDFVREEKKFNSFEELKENIYLDSQKAKEYFNNFKK